MSLWQARRRLREHMDYGLLGLQCSPRMLYMPARMRQTFKSNGIKPLMQGARRVCQISHYPRDPPPRNAQPQQMAGHLSSIQR